MGIKYVLTLYYVINSVLIIYAETSDYVCKKNMANLNTNKTIEKLAEHCKDKPCLSKCCGMNEMILMKREIFNGTTQRTPICVSWSSIGIDAKNYTIIKIHNDQLLETKKNFFNDFHVVRNRMFQNSSCMDNSIGSEFTAFISESGDFVADMTPIKTSLVVMPTEYFCVDLVYRNATKKKPARTEVMYFTAKEAGNDNSNELIFVGVASVTTSIFLIPVLLVYGLLPQLRNLSGMLLMAYVGTLLIAFMIKAILIFFSSHMKCRAITAVFYFAFLSTFFWLNIMSFDIWWTFRGQRLKRAINRRGEAVKFGWYALYGWGAPLAVTIMALIIELQENLPPTIVKPLFDTCLNSELSTLYYMYIPNGILTSINLILFMMTVYNIWLIKKKLNEFNNSSSSTKKNQNRFGLYIKMSMLMGTSWLLELIGLLWEKPPLWSYILINMYNAFIGLFIFILFILNKKTLRMLCKRCNIQCRWIEGRKFDPNVSRSTTKSSANNHGSYHRPSTDDSDVEMCDVEVSTNPNPSNIH